MRQVMEIQSSWLKEVAPHFFRKEDLQDENKKKMPKMSRVQREQQKQQERDGWVTVR